MIIMISLWKKMCPKSDQGVFFDGNRIFNNYQTKYKMPLSIAFEKKSVCPSVA